jgi:hypothetical protein
MNIKQNEGDIVFFELPFGFRESGSLDHGVRLLECGANDALIIEGVVDNENLSGHSDRFP